MDKKTASDLMEMLPPMGWGDVATKVDLMATRTELRGEMAELRGYTESGFALASSERSELRSAMELGFAEMRNEMSKLRNDMAALQFRLTLVVGTAFLATVVSIVISAFFGS